MVGESRGSTLGGEPKNNSILLGEARHPLHLGTITRNFIFSCKREPRVQGVTRFSWVLGMKTCDYIYGGEIKRIDNAQMIEMNHDAIRSFFLAKSH